MLEGIKAVIFDLDGTLVDSMWMWEAIDIEYLEKHGVEYYKGLQREIEGMSFTETANYFKEKFNLQDSIEQIKDHWNSMALYKYQHEVPMKKGMLDFLKDLKKRGIKTGIATSNSRELANAVIESLDIGQYLDEIHTSCEVAKGKPAPDIYLLVAKCLGVDPSECLVFEDVPLGIMAGKNAGMKVCAVDDEFSKALAEEKKSLADYWRE